MILPMIALRGIVIFPNILTTIDLGRDLSINALKEAANNKGMLFVSAQKDVSVSNPKADDIYSIGTIVEVKHINSTNETTRVLISGIKRAKVKNYLSFDNFISVEIEELSETNIDSIKAQALLRHVRESLIELSNINHKIPKEEIVKIEDQVNASAYANVVANLIVYQTKQKQEILELNNVEDKLELVCKNILTEIEISKVDKKIAARVKSSIERGQKEYYLKEQMKAISEELGEGEEEMNEWEKKISQAKMPKDVTDKAKKEVRRLSKMTPTSPDASVIRTYLEWLTDIKWTQGTKDNGNLELAKQILDEDHYGLEKIKERILEYLAVMQLTNSLKSPILCFVGPPGVGKTSIVRSIARALNRKYMRMSLGGVRDEAEIRGHRRTYIGAIPGKIIYLIKQAQCNNPVMLFDEIDKMSSDFRGDPASAMLEVLDPEQNNSFTDHYMEVPYDLSKTMFVATANTVDSIPPALLDRMEIIELNGYTEEEKLQIAKRYLVPKQQENNGLKHINLVVTDEAIRAIITNYTRESGVRSLEREIATICRKLALKTIGNKVDELVISDSDINEYLGIVKYQSDAIDANDEVGAATGLAWTSVGGTTLTIEVSLLPGKGEIVLTGKLGDVMKESARTAITLVRSMAKKYDIDEGVFATTDIHIHVPEGATPKDGPSAGITIATAILSSFTNRAVSKKIAMTGEVTLRGKVLAIGGLKEKALAAFRAGIKTIIIPHENKKDVGEIPTNIREQMLFIEASDIATVFNSALV